MLRIKNFNATAIAPDGILYAGDLNAIQDAAAAITDFSQTISLGTLAIGDNTLQLLKYGAGEARLTAALRTDGIVRALGGLYAGAFTTTQRDAIATGFRPYGLVILNQTNNRLEINLGTDPTPNWQPFGSNLIPGTFAGRPGAGTSNQNSFYFATDDNGGTLYYSNGTTWTKISKGLTEAPTAHHASHEFGGSDVLDFTKTVGPSGTLALRPSFVNRAGQYYFATDANGGTIYRSDGAQWLQAALGVTQTPTIPSGTITSAMLASGAAAANLGAGSVTSTMILDATILNSDIASQTIDGTAKMVPGTVAGGGNFGSAFPGSGLFTNYHYTLYMSAYGPSGYTTAEFVYRPDLDGTYPWHCTGGGQVMTQVGSSVPDDGGYNYYTLANYIAIPRSGWYEGFGYGAGNTPGGGGGANAKLIVGSTAYTGFAWGNQSHNAYAGCYAQVSGGGNVYMQGQSSPGGGGFYNGAVGARPIRLA